MSKTVVSSDNAPAAIGPYSPGIQTGNMVFLSGQLGIDPATGKMPEGVEAQAKQSLANVEALLTAAGATFADVVKTTVYLADIADFAAVNEIYAQLRQRTMEEERPLTNDDPLFLLSNQQSLYNYWKFYQRCNGIDPPISLYELRHTFVSMVADAVSPAQLRRMVGHSRSMDTFGWYAHDVTGRDVATAQTISGVLAEYAPDTEK